MDVNDILRDSYKLTNISGINITVDDFNWLQFANDLYIQKWGNYYVIFQKNNIKYLEEVARFKNVVSGGAIITFGYNSNYGSFNRFYNAERFYSEHIMIDSIFIGSLGYDSDFITAIFIPTAHANPDLVDCVSNLYMLYSNVTNYDRDTIIPRYVRDNIVPDIEKVIFNDPATIVFWSDGTKTVVKTQNNEKYNKEMGLSMAISKKMLGNNSKYYNTFKKWIK